MTYPGLKAVLFLLIFGSFLSACGGAGDIYHNDTAGDTGNDVQPTQLPTQTPSPQEVIEDWLVNLEWPASIFLGESDVILLTLVPSERGLTIEAQFAGHQTTSEEILVERPAGYFLNAVAELHATNFDVSPDGAQARELVAGKPETWNWTIQPRQAGRQRLSLSLNLAWQAAGSGSPQRREFGSFTHAFEVRVHSILGLTRTQAQQAFTVVLILVSGFAASRWLGKVKGRRATVVNQAPNPAVVLEPGSDIHFDSEERQVIQAAFNDYGRLVIEKEFLSGYSGGRAFIAVPIRSNQKADAYTIIKISSRESAEREYRNYLNYVKDTLPPITARLQQAPVAVPGGRLAALHYTFIGAPGKMPISLRKMLLEDSYNGWLERLVDTFGPNWWRQHQPYTFRLGQEYDRKLPAHYTIRPQTGQGKPLDGRQPPSDVDLKVGDLIHLNHFSIDGTNVPRKRISLVGQPASGEPPLRITYLADSLPPKISGVVTVTRTSQLQELTTGFDLHGYPHPLETLSDVLNQSLQATKSTIHGDLNLENILIGPGDMVWLIDFAETREGHTLFDFSHLAAEVITHVISAQVDSPDEYISKFENAELPLLCDLDDLVQGFFFDPAHRLEFDLSLYLSCLGALKYPNLGHRAKHFAFLTAAILVRRF